MLVLWIAMIIIVLSYGLYNKIKNTKDEKPKSKFSALEPLLTRKKKQS